jgi:hypothetical protein
MRACRRSIRCQRLLFFSWPFVESYLILDPDAFSILTWLRVLVIFVSVVTTWR